VENGGSLAIGFRRQLCHHLSVYVIDGGWV
jgi:Ni2+-binding GTPase involved in maturation of urease and hydrogenase